MTPPVRLLVCGGNLYRDADQLNTALHKMHRARPISLLIEGEAPGADQMSRDWAQLNKVPVEQHFAEWDMFGNRAGSIRNSRMLRDGKPTIGMAFPGANGTADMVKKLLAAGVPTVVGRWSDGPNTAIVWCLRNTSCT